MAGLSLQLVLVVLIVFHAILFFCDNCGHSNWYRVLNNCGHSISCDNYIRKRKSTQTKQSCSDHDYIHKEGVAVERGTILQGAFEKSSCLWQCQYRGNCNDRTNNFMDCESAADPSQNGGTNTYEEDVQIRMAKGVFEMVISVCALSVYQVLVLKDAQIKMLILIGSGLLFLVLLAYMGIWRPMRRLIDREEEEISEEHIIPKKSKKNHIHMAGEINKTRNKLQSWYRKIRDPSISLPTKFDSPLQTFDPKHDTFPKRCLILGDVGSGKSTFCQKLSKMWANEEIKHLTGYQLFLFVNLNHIPECATIEQILGDFLCAKDQLFKWQRIWEYINEHQEEIFIVFDGYDQYVSSSSSDPILGIFEGKILPDTTVMVTSRHLGVKNLMQNADQVYEMTGYSLADQKTYVDSFFYGVLDEQEKENVMEILQNIPFHEEILSNPFFLNVVCELIKEGCIQPKADVADDLFYHLVKHLCAKQSVLIEDQNMDIYRHVSKIIERNIFLKDAFRKELRQGNGRKIRLICDLGILKEDIDGCLIPTFKCLLEFAVALCKILKKDEKTRNGNHGQTEIKTSSPSFTLDKQSGNKVSGVKGIFGYLVKPVQNL